MAKQGKSGEAAEDGPSDVALIHGVKEDGELQILRQREDRLELGAVRPLREGMPISGELVRLKPRKELPLLCDVETLLEAPAPKADVAGSRALEHKGPPRVASASYRENWELVFGRREREPLVN